MSGSKHQARERGGVLIMTIVLVLLVGAMAGSMVAIHLHRDRLKGDYASKIETYYGADSAANYAVENLWSSFLASEAGQRPSILSVKSWARPRS